MGELENMMKSSVRNALLESINSYRIENRNDWSISNPGMCVLNGS